MGGNNNIAPWILGGAVLFVGYKLVQHVEHKTEQQFRNMKTKIQGVHVENDGTLNVDLLVQNPNSENFSIKSVIGDLTINREHIASVKMFGDYVVAGNQEETIPLNALVNGVNLFNKLGQYLATGKASMLFQGTFNVNNEAVPVQLSFNIPVPKQNQPPKQKQQPRK